MNNVFFCKSILKGMHYQYPNNDPEFFNGHSPNERIFHPTNGDNSTSKNFYVSRK